MASPIRPMTDVKPPPMPRAPGPDRGRPDPRLGPKREPTSDTGSNTVVPQSDYPVRSNR